MPEPTTFNAASRVRGFARSRPEAPALKVPSADYTLAAPRWDTFSFRDLDQRSDSLARGFVAQGVKPGDRALVLFRPSVDFYAVSLALFKVGAVPVLIDPGMGPKLMLRCIQSASPRVVIALPIIHIFRLLFRKAFAATEIPITVGPRLFWGGPSLEQCRLDGAEPFALVPRQASDPTMILFTSGSTGPPKGVVCGQQMFQAQVDSLTEMLGTTPGNVDVQAFAAFAMYDMCMGMCSVLPHIDLSKPAKANPAEMIAAIETHNPEFVFGSPIIWYNIARHCTTHNLRLPSLKTAITVGAPIAAFLHRQFRGILREGAELLTPYGATEAIPVTCIGGAEILDETAEGTTQGKGTCVGRPAPGIDIRIMPILDTAVSSWHEDLRLPAGELGEVVVGGLQVSAEYYEQPEGNRLSKIQDNGRILHRMGDLGYLDEQGRLWFCGRKSERLVGPYGTIPPGPAEGMFNEHPDVFRTALVGVGEPGQQIPVLCVEMEPGRSFSAETVDGLKKLVAGSRYEGFVVHFLPHPKLPTDTRHNSKIRREDLKIWAAARVPKLALTDRSTP